jgi:hypothetical protein
MAFRRDGNQAYQDSREWETWKDANRDLITAAGLPLSVLRSRADWEYLLRYGYHCDGPYPEIDYKLDGQTSAQRDAFRRLMEATLTDEEKARGSAGWHHMRSPSAPPPRTSARAALPGPSRTVSQRLASPTIRLTPSITCC